MAMFISAKIRGCGKFGLSQYETADEYLSGNVRHKLRVAKARAAEEPKYQSNVAALEKVQPQDIAAEDIAIQLGATWIPVEHVNQFIYDTFKIPAYRRGNDPRAHIFAEYEGRSVKGKWEINNKSQIDNSSEFGTERMDACKILEATLNLSQVTVSKPDPNDPNGKKTVVDEQATKVARDKQDAIKRAFTEWVYEDANAVAREEMTRIYNEKFNAVRPREFNGEHITFRGMSENVTLRPHQLNAIARVIYGGNTLLAHEVGAGKTFSMVAGAMESKRIGLCRKSLIAVPKHLVGQTAGEFLRLYPDANILVATERDFEKSNRKKFCARINAENYDAVIMGHTQLERLKLSAERQIEHFNRELADFESALKAENQLGRGKDRHTVKEIQNAVKRLKAKLEKLNDALNKKNDETIDFELLGVDKLFIDEAHYFKNLGIQTKIKNLSMSNSQRADDLYMKCRWLDETTDSKGVVFATGTPVSNSMAELYVMMKYLYREKIEKMDLAHFDSWAAVFGEMTTDFEVTVANQFKQRTRFAKFNNLPELITLCREFTDIKMAEELNLPVPAVVPHLEKITRSETQVRIMQSIVERAGAVSRREVEPTEDNMLKISTDARRMALDQRLIEPLAPDEENGKINSCVKNVVDVYKKKVFDKTGAEIERPTQLVFCDLSTPKTDGSFNVYDDIRDKLIASGIPEKEIAYIHHAKNDEQKKALFKQVNAGKIRVLLGSTEKMGAGTNVQTRLVAVHHIDCPWRPSDLTQRNGRIIRPGNLNPEIHIFNYITQETFDAYQYQLLTTKQKFISQVFNSKGLTRTAEDVDAQSMTFAEISAIASGNPLRIEQLRLDTRVKELNLLRAHHIKSKSANKTLIEKTLPAEIDKLTGTLANCEKDLAQIPPIVDNFAPIEIGGKKFNFKEELKDAGERIIQTCQSGKAVHSEIPLGEYRGLKMTLSFSPDMFGGGGYQIRLTGNNKYFVGLGTSATGNITRINNELDRIPETIEKIKQNIESKQNQIKNLMASRDKPFFYEAELQEKSAQLADVNRQLLAADKKQEPGLPPRESAFTPLNPQDLAAGEKRYQLVTDANGKEYYQFAHRDDEGNPFYCEAPTLDECRHACDVWTVTKYLDGKVENPNPLVKEFVEQTKAIREAASEELAKKWGLPCEQTSEQTAPPRRPRVQIIERGKVVGASR